MTHTTQLPLYQAQHVKAWQKRYQDMVDRKLEPLVKTLPDLPFEYPEQARRQSLAADHRERQPCPYSRRAL
jgi:hypothetical protein